MPTTSPAATTSAATPVFAPAAVAILGSMLLLIAALTVVLIQTSWATSQASVEVQADPFYPKDLAQR